MHGRVMQKRRVRKDCSWIVKRGEMRRTRGREGGEKKYGTVAERNRREKKSKRERGKDRKNR